MRGFTLVELAVVLAVVALLLGALLSPLANQFQRRHVLETKESMNEIKEALTGFAVINGRLPCPDTDSDGVENLNAPPPPPLPPNCTALEGVLPWQDLGVPPTDSWDNLYRYRVTQEFAYAAIPGALDGPNHLDKKNVGDITIVSRGNDVGTAPIENKAVVGLATNTPAVVLSSGANGAGGARMDGSTLPAPTGGDELANMNGDAIYMTRIQTDDQTGCTDDTSEATPLCEFDDIVVWLSSYAIINRLVMAHRLP